MGLKAYITKKIEILIVYFPFLVKIFSNYYKELVTREVILGDISSDDRVLCIGGGPVPCTALEIARITGARVEVIDNDPSAVRFARIIIERLGMKRKVGVKIADGRDVEPGEYSVVHIARQAYPHDLIVRNIMDNINPGSKVLIRKRKKNFNGRLFENKKGNHEIIDNSYFNFTLLLTKAKVAKTYRLAG